MVKKINNQGFTVLEMLIVCSIIVILTSAVLMNHRKADAQLRLNRAADKIAQDVRRASALALSAEAETCGDGSTIVKGYGISFFGSNGQYILYRDCGDGSMPPTIEMKETIDLEANIEIENTPTASINFSPPSPTVTVSTGTIDAILKSTRYGFEKTVHINSSGVVNIE